ncbi:Pyruvate decarboxylase 1 [Teratosphaeriaceae sp. CCFEE 6253]|nr:Pyruvate decarboxylase 1 [Teratosphaeriaceae sp. CCFEE 6253]
MAEIKLGQYLFARLAHLGIKTSSPGPGATAPRRLLPDPTLLRSIDRNEAPCLQPPPTPAYELALLDLISDAGLAFRGNANELIAAYAADGYARINGTAGALVTTFGPGELSAYCGHAGAYAEFVPVVHVVGYPGVEAMRARTLMHHSLGTGEFGVDTAVLTDPATAGAEIDRCLHAMLRESRPVYIGVPVDMSHHLVPAEGLKTPLRRDLPANDPSTEEQVVAEIWARIQRAKNPIIILDGNAVRNNLQAEANRLAEVSGWKFFTTCMGKGGADESLPNYAGVYQGGGSIEVVRKAVEDDADLVLWIGSFRTDFNTGEMTIFVDEAMTVDLQRFFTRIGAQRYEAGMKGVLTAILGKVEADGSVKAKSAQVEWDPYPLPEVAKERKQLTQDFLWDALATILKPDDLVVGETGTSAFGLAATRYPRGCTGYNQTVFGSIGYAGPSFTGALQAAAEAKTATTITTTTGSVSGGTVRRGILVTGEGSLQLTPMCFADLLKLDLRPLVFVLNNNGYTVERLIHGPTAEYNTLPAWDYRQLCTVFGPGHRSQYYGPITTCEGLATLLESAEMREPGECFQVSLRR